MSDNKNNIQDDEFRVLGRRTQPDGPATGPTHVARPDGKTGRRGLAGVISLLIILAIGLLVYFNWPGGDEPTKDPGIFDPAPVKVDQKIEKTPFGSPADSLRAPYAERIDTTVNDVVLTLYIPHNAVPRLTVGAPDAEARKAFLAFQAADIRADNRKILGAFVLKGQPLAWGLSKKGYCAIIDGKVTIGTAENSPLFEEATEKEGYFFRQYPLVDRGTLVESELKNKTMRKALCDRAGQVFVAVSQTDESMHDFAQALVDLGVDEAIYLVGSHSAFGWWRDEDGRTEYFSLDRHRQSFRNESYIIWDAWN